MDDTVEVPTPPPRRLASIDAYRGFVMFLLIAESFHLASVASKPDVSPVWKFLAHHQEHVEWVGCTLHDMIQPSFSFLVGVALPFSLLSRAAQGQSKTRRTLHAFWRAFVLVAMGIFLRSMGRDRTNFTFEDTLTQIGLGYGFLYLLATRSVRVQAIALVVILVGYWAAFAAYPLPASDFDYTKVGVKEGWPHLMTGFPAHWNKNSNIAWRFDVWFMNLFTRKEPFQFNGGGYSTLSFIPTLGTMILGLLAGGLLVREDRRPWPKVGILIVAGAITFGAGYALGELGVCPVVKRIWTPSWTLYSGGICLMILGVTYAICDAVGFKIWAYPLVVIGANSIAAYLLTETTPPWISAQLKTHLGQRWVTLKLESLFGQDAFHAFMNVYQPVILGAGVVFVIWLILLWMYRRRIFLKV